MTVFDLISILQQHDPAAIVVLRGDADGDGDDAQSTLWEELRRGAVWATQLKQLKRRPRPARDDVGWDPLDGATLYTLADAGEDEDEDEAVDVVQLG